MSNPSQTSIDFDALTKELRETIPRRASQTEDAFIRLLPAIRDALDRKVTRKALLCVLAKNGLKISPAKFKGLMEKHEQLATVIQGGVAA